LKEGRENGERVRSVVCEGARCFIRRSRCHCRVLREEMHIKSQKGKRGKMLVAVVVVF